jgi:MFS family permease
MPLALLLGLKKESIGACYSINRDSNYGLTTDIFGPESPETKGTFAVYIVGSVIGTICMSLLVNFVASWGIFHPYALGMATGVGSGSMMAAGTASLSLLYPEFAEEIAVFGSTSDMLTGITGIYMGTFVALPLTKWFYRVLEPRIGRRSTGAKGE